MDKKELLNIVFNLLYKSNLVFSIDSFEKELNEEMKLIKFEIAPQTYNSLIKELVAKDYLNQDNDFLVKSDLLLKNDKNKQTDYLKYMIEENAESFDINYIHDEYVKNIKNNEQIQAKHLDYVENSYDTIKKYLIDKNFVKENSIKNQFEL